MIMRDFRELQVWRKGHELTLTVYRTTQAFPDDERFSLTSQMRRSAASIPTNIAEGCGRQGDAELARFLQISMGSASELEYLTMLTHDLQLLDDAVYRQLDAQVVEVKKMLSSFLTRLRRSSSR
jgi:four helix bundle protein